MTEMTIKLTRGRQIIYVPDHAHEQVDHPDCEKGFVTSVDGDYAFCRYWRRHPPFDLRTKANSERTPVANLVVQDTVPPIAVEAALERWCPE